MSTNAVDLAYIGDTVYDLYVRRRLLEAGWHVRDMHERATKIVCASAQSAAFLRISGILSDDESAVARRAINAHLNPPKSADHRDYQRATALEAVVGYLYLEGRSERLSEIMALALSEEPNE